MKRLLGAADGDGRLLGRCRRGRPHLLELLQDRIDRIGSATEIQPIGEGIRDVGCGLLVTLTDRGRDDVDRIQAQPDDVSNPVELHDQGIEEILDQLADQVERRQEWL